ncbi:MAG: transposase [Bdellovibrionaceae bacterium]|nr:transposase [Pseudobdellovibrionaceae bacterium]
MNFRGIDEGIEILFSNPSVKKSNWRNPFGVHILSLLILTAPVFACLPALAQEATSTLPVGTTGNNNKRQLYGNLRFEGMQYMTTLPESPKLTYSQFLSAQVSYVGETTWFENGVDFGAGTFFSRSQSHIAVHELYTSPRTDGYRFYAGRKLNDWSAMDREWNMGVWQPYFEIDALRPEPQGLSGIFFDVNRDDYQVLAFATPLFIPTMGPGIREENGALVSDSRWYRSPVSQQDFIGRPIPITYSLSVPETTKLASHGGYGAMGRVGDKAQGAWIVTSAGYTPVNTLVLKRNIRVPILDPKVGVVVSPEVAYHQIFSTDIGYSTDSVRTTVSYMQDDPETKLPETDWAVQRLTGIRAYSVNLDWNIPQFMTRSILLQLNYLKIDGGGITDIVSDGSPDTMNLFDQRMRFTNAIKAKIQGELARFSGKPLFTKFSYLYDNVQKGSMINSEFLFYPSPKWALVAGADILGVDNEDYKTSSFLNQYRANDRIYGGMTYVF